MYNSKIPNNQEHNSKLYTPIKIGKKESICLTCKEEDCKGHCKRYAEKEKKLRKKKK